MASMFSPLFTSSGQNSPGSLKEGQNKAVFESDVTKLGDV